MSEPTLLLSALFALVTGAVYAYVGLRLARREVVAEARLAAKALAVWWGALAVVTLGGGAIQVTGFLGVLSLGPMLVWMLLALALLCVALGSLLYYLAYLYTGSRRVLLPITFGYVAYFLALVHFVATHGPERLEITRWSVQIQYASEPTGAFPAILTLLLLGPQILAAGLYFTLIFRVTDRTQRYRVATVAIAVLVWFSSALLAYSFGISDRDAWQVASRLIGIAATVAILFAYLPPAWLQRALGVRSIEDEAGSRAAL